GHAQQQGIVTGTLSTVHAEQEQQRADLERQRAAGEHAQAMAEAAYKAAETKRLQGGVGALTPIDEYGKSIDPNNPKAKVSALRQPDGTIHFLPRPSPW